MNKFAKRLLSVATALAVALTTSVSLSYGVLAVDTTTPIFSAEAENCTLTTGASVATNVYGTQYPDYSGDGFVWAGNSGGVTFEVTLEESAMYEVSTRCWMYLGSIGETRMQNISIDGTVKNSCYIPNNGKWSDYSFGFYYLEKGTHTIEIGSSGSWGFVLYDTVTFDFADMPELNVSADTADTNATAETKALKQYMTQMYGNQIISGQQEIYGGGNNGDTELEFEYIHDNTGKYPAIRGFDMMNYNPLYGWEDGTTGRMIQWVTQRGGIATTSWHINVPLDFTNYKLGDKLDWKQCTYKPNSTFNTANCLDTTTKEYQYLMLAIDDLAEQLLTLQKAGVPVILRPFHEAEGNNNTNGSGAWFWWGSAGSEVYKQLWQLLYTTLTEKYGVHNCIWEVNLYTYANSAQWYPGDEYVDMVAYDKYEGSPYTWGTSAATSAFLNLVGDTNDTKMVALSENDVIPDITNMVNEGAWWSYFCPWYGSFITDGKTNTVEMLNKIYNSDKVVTLDEVPSNVYGYERGNGGNFNVEGAYECENGTVTTNNGTKIINYNYCSGTGYVYLQGKGDYIEQTVAVAKDGLYALKYGYQQNFETAGKTQNLYINGESVGTAFFPYSIMFGESNSTLVKLKAGTNTIKLESADGWTYLDYLTLEYAGTDIAKGDINADGVVSVSDLVLLKKYVLGITTLTEQQLSRAELSGDTKINSLDASMLMQILLTA